MSAAARPAVRRAGRTRLRVAGLVLIVAVGVGLVAWPRVGAADAQAAAGALTTSTSQRSPGVGAYGITLGADVAFGEDRVLTRGRILVDTAGPAPYVSFTPQDGTDEDRGYPLPRGLAAGVTATAEVTVLPACGVEVTEAPVFEVDSRPDDGLLTPLHMLVSDPRTDTVPAAALDAWQVAVRDWCASGVHALVSESSTTLEGGVVHTLTVYNPGPDPVTVVCPAERNGDLRWEHAEVTVGAGSTAELTVRGDKPALDRVPPLTANGELVPVRH